MQAALTLKEEISLIERDKRDEKKESFIAWAMEEIESADNELSLAQCADDDSMPMGIEAVRETAGRLWCAGYSIRTLTTWDFRSIVAR